MSLIEFAYGMAKQNITLIFEKDLALDWLSYNA